MDGLLGGKQGLIFGIANDRSYAWHIAQALLGHGAECGYAHLPGEKNERRTARAVEKLDGAPESPWLHPCDASSDEEIEAVFAAYRERFDRLDFIIHSIAFADREWLQAGAFVSTPRASYLSAVDISAYTLVSMARAGRAQMAANGGGAILAMSYYGSEKVVSGYNVMGVAKAALECSARYLASDLGPDGIRVNTISGGPLKTLAASAVGGIDVMLDATPKHAPLRRNVEGGDVGGTAAWLVSDLGRGVTAENIYVDCGINAIGAAV
ncbi:MAG: enoyl-ACP reductase [Planctomycetota bacterium]